MTNGSIGRWRVLHPPLHVTRRVTIGWMTAGIGPPPFRILHPGFLRYLAGVRERGFPIPLRALFITARRAKIASLDVNGSVV